MSQNEETAFWKQTKTNKMLEIHMDCNQAAYKYNIYVASSTSNLFKCKYGINEEKKSKTVFL